MSGSVDRELLKQYIGELAHAINVKYAGRSIDELGGNLLFAKNTIKLKGDDLPYAYHLGGRKNLQFNIGFEPYAKGKKVRFRHGVAFAFQASGWKGYDIDSIIKALRPKTKGFGKHFNKCNNRTLVSKKGFKTWYWDDEIECENKLVDDIDLQSGAVFISRLARGGVFFMLGKCVPLAKFKGVATDDESIIEHWTGKVLDDFDFLYENVYLHVQSGAG